MVRRSIPYSRFATDPWGRRHALTLVELLVVITILVLLLGVVLPLAQPAIKQRGVREAARQVQTFLTAAQSRALAEERFVGVLIDVDHQSTFQGSGPASHWDDVAYGLRMLELPMARYQTEVFNEVYEEHLPNDPDPGQVTPWAIALEPTAFQELRSVYQSLPTPRKMYVLLGNYGTLFRLPRTQGPDITLAFRQFPGVQVVAGNPPQVIQQNVMFLRPLNGTCTTDNYDEPPSTGLMAPRSVRGMSLRVYYEPVPGANSSMRARVTAAPRIELPVGTYIDISWSGVGLASKFLDDMANLASNNALPPTPLMIVFGPDGRVAWLEGRLDRPSGNPLRFLHTLAAAFNTCGPFIPQEDIHLLIGRQKRRPRQGQLPIGEALKNLEPDSGSYWVSISPSTGAVAASENLGSRNTGTNPSDVLTRVIESRRSARSTIRIGGN